jgi:hypothetical protein
MIAIQTKYLSATNTKGARIKAWAAGRDWSVTIPYPYELSYELCHFEAVKAFVKKHNLDWDLTNMRHGGTESGYVFCFDSAIVKG